VKAGSGGHTVVQIEDGCSFPLVGISMDSLKLSYLRLTPQLYESAGGLPRLKLPLHSCSLAWSTSEWKFQFPLIRASLGKGARLQLKVSKLGRPPALCKVGGNSNSNEDDDDDDDDVDLENDTSLPECNYEKKNDL
ncbi:hypothetical protein Tco_1047928, partial [Tanacetum coccineum]